MRTGSARLYLPTFRRPDSFVTFTATPIAAPWNDKLPGGIQLPLTINTSSRRTE